MKLIINIKGTNIELTDAITEYFHKRMEGVEKMFDTHKDAEVVILADLGKTSNRHKSGDIFKADVKLSHIGMELYAVSEKDDLYAAIDDVKDELMSEIKKGRTKGQSLLRRGGAQVKNILKGFGGIFSRRKRN